MIWLWILGILLALVALVCLLRVGVTVYLDERVTLDVRAGPVRFHIDPDQPKKPKKNKKPDKEKKPKETKPEKAKKPEKKAAPAASEATDQLLSSMKKRKRM